jgi:hypothetical protein
MERSATTGLSRAPIAAPAIRAWYLPSWVSNAWWLASPQAYNYPSSTA